MSCSSGGTRNGIPGLPDLALGPDEALGHARLGDQEGARDLDGGQAADLAEGQRYLRLGSQGGVAAREDERKPLVGNRAHLVLGFGQLGEALEKLRLTCQRAVAPNAVHGAVAGRRDDPRARIPGLAFSRPAFQSRREGVLNRVLGEVEVAEDADEDCDRMRPFLPENAFDRAQRSTIGRTSIEPYSAAGIFAA